MNRLRPTLAILLIALAHAVQASPPLTREQAEEASRLSPREFPGIPTPIVEDLESRGCTIPQSDVGPRPQNAIQGKFYRPSQTDWAVLCSRNGQSSILVYARGSASKVEELARRTEEFTFDVLENGVQWFGFNRMIVPVGKRFILKHHSCYEGPGEPPPTPDLPPIDHQGINDAWPERASIVRYYWPDSGWTELAGAD